MLTQAQVRAGASWVANNLEWADTIPGAVPVSRRGHIAAALREAIVTGRIPTGAQLKQDEIGSLFRTSPGPVREALRQLVSEGLVEHYPNRGAFVSDIPVDELLEVVLPVRLVAESYAMKKVSQDLQPDLVRRLSGLIAAMDVGAEREDLAEVIEADVRFHQAIMSAAGAYHVTQLWESMRSRMRVQLYRLGPRHRSLREVPDEHRQLLAALQSGDHDLIHRVLEQHIIEASSVLLVPDATELGGDPNQATPQADRPQREEGSNNGRA